MLAGTLAAAAEPGRASIAWIASSSTAAPAAELQTAIRMTLDPGWHSYWINPGEAGMQTTVEWKLPQGWTTRGLLHPVPMRFESGGLAGFGYEGTVWFPVTLKAPADFTGEARLGAVISWLACNDSGCIPGRSEIQLIVSSGTPAPGPDAGAVRTAYQRVPQPAPPGTRFSVTEMDGTLRLEITPSRETPWNPGGCDVFPATPDVLDPRAPLRFSESGSSWVALVPKSDYARGPVGTLTLVLACGARPPLEITWPAP
jgi:thiol:disulfide interchange protein DsbD